MEILSKIEDLYNELVEMKANLVNRLNVVNVNSKSNTKDREVLNARENEVSARERIVKGVESVIKQREEINKKREEVASDLKKMEALDRKVKDSIVKEKALKKENVDRMQTLASKIVVLKEREADVDAKIKATKSGLINKLNKELGIK